MTHVRHAEATYGIFEVLEPRLLLSGSASPGVEWLNLADVPRFVTADWAPVAAGDDLVSGRLRQARRQLEDVLAADPSAARRRESLWAFMGAQ